MGMRSLTVPQRKVRTQWVASLKDRFVEVLLRLVGSHSDHIRKPRQRFQSDAGFDIRHIKNDWNEASCKCHWHRDRKSTRLNSSHLVISYAVFCLKKKI